MDVRWRIELFGGLQASHDDRIIKRFRTRKSGALLAYLAYYGHRSHPRDELVELLWPECDRRAGRHRLCQALYSLRRQLEPPGVSAGALVLAGAASLQLNPSAFTTDVAQFESGLRDAGRAGSALEKAHTLVAALELYRGELLPGCFEEWVLPERLRLVEAFLQSLHQIVVYLEEAGEIQAALPYARRAVSVDPLREEAQFDLIRLLAAAGESAAVLRQYQELERLLAEQVGVTPAPEIRAFVRSLQQRVPKEAGEAPRATTPHPGTVDAPRRPPKSASPPLPTGTVTFLLAQVAGEEVRREGDGDTHEARHEECLALLRPLFRRYGGQELPASGDTARGVFGRASDALAAAVTGQQTIAAGCGEGGTGRRRVRMALHTGEVESAADALHGPALQDATHLLLAAHGGQILLSEGAAGLLRSDKAQAHLTDLGLYRLRGQSPPERLFQASYPGMTPHEFAPPNAEPGFASSLPPSLTRFFGREAEIARLKALLLGEEAGGRRLVTLTGPGGSGKSRLALEVARRLREPLQGALWFVPLVDLTEPQLVAVKVLEALRLPRSPHLEPLEQVATFLRSHHFADRRPSLLLLDNFEHLLDAGGATVRSLLEQVPALTCLVTSRQPLEIAGEHEFLVAPLPTPVDGSWLMVDGPAKSSRSDPSTISHQLSTLSQYPSVALFVDRAQAARPDFAVTARNAAAVAQLCERLEGIPLALELAAARAGALTPEQMLARLDQRFELLVSRRRDALPRHRSLRVALEWSYQLLTPELQRFFARLSVFRGGWTLDAAEQVCQEPRALECLEELQNGSIVEAVPGSGRQSDSQLSVDTSAGPRADEGELRFRLLETLREFGREQLGPEERADVARQHARYYLALAEEAEPELSGADQGACGARLEREHDNLRAALDWLVASGEVEDSLRLAGALWEFWGSWDKSTEGRRRLASVLALAGAEARAAARAKALLGAGVLAYWQGDPAARPLLEESVAIRRELGDRKGAAFSQIFLGELVLRQGEVEAARFLHEECLAIGRELGDERTTAHALHCLGQVALAEGDASAAQALLQESQAVFRKCHRKRGLAWTLTAMGDLALSQGDTPAARAFFEESLAIRRELGTRGYLAGSLSCLGNVARLQGDLAVARAAFEECLAICRELGDRDGIAECLEELAAVSAADLCPPPLPSRNC